MEHDGNRLSWIVVCLDGSIYDSDDITDSNSVTVYSIQFSLSFLTE